MRFIHLSDLHLGKNLNGFSLLEYQKKMLSRIFEEINKNSVEAIVIAGDVFDHSNPSNEAVELFDSFLFESYQRKLPCLIIPGNHDNAQRLSFAKNIFKNSSIHIARPYEGRLEKVMLKDAFGSINFYLLPYLSPYQVRLKNQLPCQSFEEALKIALSGCSLSMNERNVILAHQFVTGAELGGSEQKYLGGSEEISKELFCDFDYVALGHIHKPQHFGRESLRYCGSPMNYSLSEAKFKKKLCIVDMKEKGNISIETPEFESEIKIIELRGSLNELIDENFHTKYDKNAFFHVTLTDSEYQLDASRLIQKVYPLLLEMKYERNRGQIAVDELYRNKENSLSVKALFEDLFKRQHEREMSSDEEKIIDEILEEMREGSNED